MISVGSGGGNERAGTRSFGLEGGGKRGAGTFGWGGITNSWLRVSLAEAEDAEAAASWRVESEVTEDKDVEEDEMEMALD